MIVCHKIYPQGHSPLRIMTRSTFLIILGAFAELRKANISFVISVRLSTCLSVRSIRMDNSVPTGRISMEFDIWLFVYNLLRKFKSHWNMTIIAGTFLIIKPTRCTNFSNLFLKWNSTCFGQFLCPSSGVFLLYTQQWYMSYRFVDSLWAGTEWNSWWWTEELSQTCRVSLQNKFEKLMDLVGFIIRNLSWCMVTWTSNQCMCVWMCGTGGREDQFSYSQSCGFILNFLPHSCSILYDFCLSSLFISWFCLIPECF
jgi:hypothetical protein